MNLPPLTYLTFDSLTEGVGRSQVMPYMEGLARRQMSVTLHSFEKAGPDQGTADKLRTAGVRWVPHHFGSFGPAGGLRRVIRGALAVRGASLVHARGDLAAASAMLAHCDRWIWDMRGFWADERIDLGMLKPGLPEERVMRLVERRAACSAAHVITLAAAAIPVLTERHGSAIAGKTSVIPTCVDLGLFEPSAMPERTPLRVLISGTLNARYDVPLMVALSRELGRRRPVDLRVLCPDPGRWRTILEQAGARLSAAEGGEMPAQVSAAHIGLSVLKMRFRVTDRASMPTKIGEFLAAGRPVVVSDGLGDMSDIVREFDCGVVIQGSSESEVRGAATEIERLVNDKETPGRCRAAATEHFDLEIGLSGLMRAYAAALGRS